MEYDSEQHAKIEKFIGVTGAAFEFASSFLEAAEWNVNQALDMYLGGGAAQAQNLSNSHMPPNNVDQAKHERLMARARKIMEEQKVDEVTAMAIAEAQGDQAPQVRAPIAQTTTRLIDHSNPYAGRNPRLETEGMLFRMEAEMNQMRQRMLENAQNGGLSVAFNTPSQPVETVADTQHRTNLQDLFSPPTDLMFQGTWEQVREHAKNTDKWVLVNIQKESEFLSYILNRDLWCNEIVKELINASFVFFQHEDTDSEAIKYKTFYNPGSFPHVAIIDPFTGELVREIELTPYQNNTSDLLSTFLELTNNFLDRNQLEGEKMRNLQAKMLQRHKEKDAERAKAANASPPARIQTPIEPNQEVLLGNDSDIEILEKMEDIEDEPAPGPSVTTVQFRFPAKKPVKRRFFKTEKISSLFAFAQQELNDTKSFDLICYPNKSLKGLAESSIVEERLVNTTVSVKFL